MTKPRSSAEVVREAFDVVGAISRASADRVELDPLFARLSGVRDSWIEKEMGEIGRMSNEGRRAELWRVGMPVFETVYLPAMGRHLIDRVLLASDEPPDAIATAQILSVIASRYGRVQSRFGRALDKIADALGDHAVGSSTRLQALIESDDVPDLNTIAFDLLRIESVRWILETLNQPKQLGELNYHARRLCRLTLNRSTAIINGFAATHDILALFDTIAVIAQVDNLLTITGRLFDAMTTGEEERTAFVATDDEAALKNFGTALLGHADLLGRVIAKGVGRSEPSAAVVTSALKQFVSVHNFTRKLGETRSMEFDALDERLGAIASDLVVRLERALMAAVEAGAESRGLAVLRDEAQAFAGILDELGLGEGRSERLRRALNLLGSAGTL